MRKILIGLLMLAGGISANAQYRTDYGFRIGAANYLGDIGGKENTRRDFIWDMKLSQTRWNLGGFYRYRFNKMLAVNTSLNYLRLQGNDALTSNRGRRARNLSFKNDMLDLNTRGEFYFYTNNDVAGKGRYFLDLKMYLHAGVGALIHAPKTTYNAANIKLRPQQTEGNKYGIVTATIPLGLGMYFTHKRSNRYGLELIWHASFTDYLDDISTIYTVSNSPVANRHGELPADEIDDLPSFKNYLPGQKRGDSNHNDNYLTLNFTYSYVTLGSKANTLYRQHAPGAKYKRNVKRKIRAKF